MNGDDKYYKTSEKIEIEPNKKYYITASTKFSNALYSVFDENDNLLYVYKHIGTDSASITDEEYITPPTAKYLYISWLNTINTASLKTSIKISKLQNIQSEIINAKTGYESLYDAIHDKRFDDDIKNILIENNYIDCEFEYEEGNYLITTTPVITAMEQNIYKLVKYTNITPGEEYLITGSRNYGNICYAIFDSSDHVLLKQTPFTQSGSNIIECTESVIIPDGAAYIAIAAVSPHNVKIKIRNGYKNILTDDIESMQNNINNLLYKYENKNLILVRSNDLIQIISDFSSTKYMAIKCNLHGSSGKAFNFTDYQTIDKNTNITGITNGTLFKTSGDDIAPLHFCNSYLGGNHGYQGGYTLVFNTDHNLTEADIGNYMVDANGRNVLILKIINSTNILTCQPKEDMTDAIGPFYMNAPTSPVTYNGTQYTFTILNDTFTQMTPALNHVNVKLLADGVEITDLEGIYNCNEVDILETYDIIYLPAMVNYLIDNAGNNTNDSYYSDDIEEAYCTVTIDYKFMERGICVVSQNNYFHKQVQLEHVCMIQSQAVGNYALCPGTNLKLLTQQSSSMLTINGDNDYHPSRYYQYDNINLTKGFVIGYNTEYFDGKPENRAGGSGYYSAVKKIYARVRDQVEIISAGTTYSTIAFRIPLNVYDEDIPCVCYYYLDDCMYVMIDIQKSINKDIKLPDKALGKKVEILESFGNISLPYNIISTGYLKVIVDTYGSAVIKLY